MRRPRRRDGCRLRRRRRSEGRRTSLTERPRGRLYVGTSGFAYPDWAPRFYAPGLKSAQLLPAYAERLPACEINTTYYGWPSAEQLARWAAATPDEFRFVLKAQRGSSARALGGNPAEAIARLTAPLPALGSRLGAVLVRVPDTMERDDDGRADERLAAFLDAWPAEMPLALEARHPSWERDEVLVRLRAAGAAWVTTDGDEAEPPTIRTTGPFLSLRLRRTTYTEADLAAWAARFEPFLSNGTDVFVFFRHDADGASALAAERLGELLAAT